MHSQFRTLVFVAASAATSLVGVRAASAQVNPDVAPPPVAQAVMPGVLSTSAGATIEGRVDYVRFDDTSDDVSLFALDVHGQYVSPVGIGGYLSLPLAFGVGDGESESAVGNLELGGLYVIRSRDVDVYLRAGAALGTASDDGVLAVPITHVIPRTADAVVTGLDTSWLRGGGGVRFKRGSLVVGGSAGVDLPLEGEDGIDGVLHLTAAIGTEQPTFGVSAGLTVLQALEDDSDSIIGLHGVADVALSGRTRLFFSLGLGIEDGSEGLSLGAGVRAAL